MSNVYSTEAIYDINLKIQTQPVFDKTTSYKKQLLGYNRHVFPLQMFLFEKYNFLRRSDLKDDDEEDEAENVEGGDEADDDLAEDSLCYNIQSFFSTPIIQSFSNLQMFM